MVDEEDSLEIRGVRMSNQDKGSAAGARAKFLSVWFRCCHTYGRMTRNKSQSAYEGRCPKCGAKVHATIGSNGTSRRVFEAR
jgi:hypothetical protein